MKSSAWAIPFELPKSIAVEFFDIPALVRGSEPDFDLFEVSSDPRYIRTVPVRMTGAFRGLTS